jgi:serine/threonine-protein kinase RsbT
VPVSNETRVPIRSDLDIVAARQKGRELAAQIGFSPTDMTFVATAISELARNIVAYAGEGEIQISVAEKNSKKGIIIMCRDHGPGIANLRDALRDGYSTSGSLGLGLPGVKRLMDDFEIKSEAGRGTIVTVRKWQR